MLLLDQEGSESNMLVCCRKFSNIFLINCNDMGKYQTGPNKTDRVIQSLPNAIGATSGYYHGAMVGIWGGPAYYRMQNRQFIYFCGHDDHLKVFELKNGRLSQTPISESFDVFSGFDGNSGGSIPSVSSLNSKQNSGNVWTLDRPLINPPWPSGGPRPQPVNLCGWQA
jgi:hypothetical protein